MALTPRGESVSCGLANSASLSPASTVLFRRGSDADEGYEGSLNGASNHWEKMARSYGFEGEGMWSQKSTKRERSGDGMSFMRSQGISRLDCRGTEGAESDEAGCYYASFES